MNENPSLFEWFYIDVHQADGHDLVFTLHTRPFMSQFKIAIFDVFLYYQNQVIFHEFFAVPQEEVQQSEEILIVTKAGFYLNLKIANTKSVFEVKSDTVQIYLELENRFRKGLPLVLDLFENKQEKSFQWQLFMPQARARGEIVYRTHKKASAVPLKIEGTGYLDSNRGNINLKKELAYWRWAKIYFKKALWIVGSVNPVNGNLVNLLVKCKDESVRVERNVAIDFRKDEWQIASGEETVKLRLTSEQLTDDIRFLVACWPRVFNWPMKIIEVIAGLAIRKKKLSWLVNVLTNGRYLRKRWQARTEAGEIVEIFGEEMFLNG